jgi:UDP-4-amino-4,6-dideoxy-N-acetyl-beta-L-altrosamine transaminase
MGQTELGGIVRRAEFLPYCQPLTGDEEVEELIDTLKSGWLSTGPKTIKLEGLLREYVGAKEAVCVNSCTAALHLSLIALDIGPGDEVITSPFTFASSANVIIHVGAKPVFMDIRKDTYNIDPGKIEAAITPRTKAIMPVHYAGQPCDMETIIRIARKHNICVIEDAAHAIGAEYQGKKVGTMSDATCFSFYATKNMTTGEGGAITTNDSELADRCRVQRLHGIDKDAWKRYSAEGSWYYEVKECGWKYNMSDIQAALGIPQLKKLDSFIETRRKYAQIYSKEFSKLEGVITPYESPEVKHVYHLYPMLLKEYNRDEFIEKMMAAGIGCSVHFIPLHLQPFYKEKFDFTKGAFPNAEWVYEREVSLPLYPKMSEDDVWRVITTVNKILHE